MFLSKNDPCNHGSLEIFQVSSQERDVKGRFSSSNPKTITMRVTLQEKRIIEKFRKIQPTDNDQSDHFINELKTLIRKRVNNIEL